MEANQPREQHDPSSPPAARKRGFWHFLLKSVKYAFLLLCVIILGVGAGAYWITQTQRGQQWLINTLNPLLAVKPGIEGTGIRISHLTGNIPFDFKFGLEISDKDGIWLKAPANKLIWNWKNLPDKLHINLVSAQSVDMNRFPSSSQEDTPKENKPPFTLIDFQNILKDTCSFLSRKHWWLPDIVIDQISLSALLPKDLLPSPQKTDQRLHVQAQSALSLENGDAAVTAAIDATGENGSRIEIPAIAFSQAGVRLNLKAGPKTDGLKAEAGITANMKSPVLAIKDLAPNMLGDEIDLSLDLKANALASTQKSALAIDLSGPNLSAGMLQMTGGGKWQSDSGWEEGRISGPLNYGLNLKMTPAEQPRGSLLAAIQDTVDLSLGINGVFPQADVAFLLDCGAISHSGHTLKNSQISLHASDLVFPVDSAALESLENEKNIQLKAETLVDSYPAAIRGGLFVQNLPLEKDRIWRAGARNLTINALGIAAAGSIAAMLYPGKSPLLDGWFDLDIENWKDLNALLGYKIGGDIKINAKLDSSLPREMANPEKSLIPGQLVRPSTDNQNAYLGMDIANFSLDDKNASIVKAGKAEGRIQLENIFANPGIKADIKAKQLSAAGLNLDAGIHADGRISGPLQAEINSSGSINSRIAAQWQPGMAKLGTLDISADLSTFLKKSKKLVVAVKSAQPATITYGNKGVQISNLDIRLTPSGHIKANGGVAPDKLDLKLDVNELDFKPWQVIVPQIPAGSANLTANLSGTPKRPGGQFHFGLKNLDFPKNPLPPINLGLAGSIEHGSRGSQLKIRTELDPGTVKALGGDLAQITASIPLSFGSDGVPRPDMKGPLQAQVKWNGALGPVWNLVPIADCRLNGRVNIDMSAAGTLDKPALRGHATIQKARFEDILLGILLTDINVNVNLSDNGLPGKKGVAGLPGSMTLAMSLSDGRGGKFTANGSGALDGSDLNLNAMINNLRPLRRRDIHVELSGKAHVGGSAFSPLIDGEIIVDKGEVLLNNLDFMSSVTTLPITNPATAKKIDETPPVAANKKDGNLNVRVIIRPRFTVEGRGLASLWKANLLISGPLNDPHVTGNIESVRGNFDFLGKIFALTKGIVFFGGGSISNPLIDLDLTHETSDLTAHILVTGPVNKIRIRMTSDPAIPRDEIISKVLFGRSVNDLSRMEALQLAAAVAQLAGFGGGTSILSSAKKALGVDVLKIGTADSRTSDQSAEDTGGGTTIEMGKYINDYIYMGVQQGFGADSTAFIIEIEISPRASFELRSDQANTWGGFRWKYNY